MGFAEGRSSERWIDWDFFGHQFVTHLDEQYSAAEAVNRVDWHGVPVPHFGVVLQMEQFHQLANRLMGKVEFVIEPYTRFQGQPGEQATMFFRDPSGNALEFKAFKDLNRLFSK